MAARFLRRDDANEPLAAPRLHDAIDLGFEAAEGYELQLAIVFRFIDPFDDLLCEYPGGRKRRDAVFRYVPRGLVLVPFELQFVQERSAGS